jgi:diadenosine tetraphosphate (Ap4A) HIT family hydrolase
MSQPKYIQRIETARNGANPTLVCKVPSGWVFLANIQFFRGYCILQSDPIVESLNSLGQQHRGQYLGDMALIGDAILEVTHAYRINYAIMGNLEPVLHSHIVPRYSDEPSQFLTGLPWSYPQAQLDSIGFDFERDNELMKELSAAIQKRL